MPSLSVTVKTSISPKQFLDALTDFGPERETIWSNSQPSHFILHSLGANEADVTEGSKILGGVWERVQYDWSKPNTIEIRTIDSNLWAKGSGWRYDLNEQDDGSGSLITATVTRYAGSKKGYLLLIILGSFGRPLITRNFKQTLLAIENQVQSNL